MSEIHNRSLGKYPLSIATSLAIESLTNTHDEIKHKLPPLQDTDVLYVNLRTLVRNIHGAVPTPQRHQLYAHEVEEALYSEMATIAELVAPVRVVYYASDMDLTKYRHALIRKQHTKLQAQYEGMSVKAIASVLGHFKLNPTTQYTVEHFKLKIKVKEKNLKGIILTHFPIDLLVYTEFKSLLLLESHTGVIKDRSLWYTKYFNGNKTEGINRIPFTEKFLQIFGDKETFSPMNQKFREDLLALAKRYNWTYLTTDDKVKYSLDSLLNPMEKTLYLQL